VTTGGLQRPETWDKPVEVPEAPRPKTILVPFDGSQNAERALSWSVLAARNNDAEVVVVVAFDPPLTVRGRGAVYVEEMTATLEEEARGLAEESVSILQGRSVRARGIVVRGDVARAILHTADEEAVDLIIIGRQGVTHEMGDMLDRFRALASGGIAEKVSRHATVPVLVVV
jgi:nucleotide-binding universal stress UspA family protein